MGNSNKSTYSLNRMLLIGFISLAIVCGSIYQRRDSELQQFVLAQFEAKYPHLRFNIGSTEFIEGRGIRLRALSVADAGRGVEPFLEIDELFLESPVSVVSLLYRKLEPKQLLVQSPKLYLDSPDELTATLGKLRTDVTVPTQFPVQVRGASILIRQKESAQKQDNSPASFTFLTKGLKSIRNRLTGENRIAQSFGGITVTVFPPDYLQPDGDREPDWVLQGHATNSTITNLYFHGKISRNLDQWVLQGEGENLDIDPQLLQTCQTFGTMPEDIQHFRGKTSFAFSANSDSQAPNGFVYQVRGEFFQGALSHQLFKHPLSNIYAGYQLTDKEIYCPRITARSGQTAILADYQLQKGVEGVTPDRSVIHTRLENLPLDNETLSSLDSIIPNDAIRVSDFLDFSTTATIEMKLQNAEGKWRPQFLTLSTNHLNLCFEKFPYRVQNLAGTLTLDESENLRFRFTSTDETRSLELEGSFRSLFQGAQGEVVVSAKGYRLDEKLFRAIPERHRDQIMQLGASGTADAQLQFKLAPVQQPDGGRLIQLVSQYQVAVREGSICYEPFPYRVNGIAGQLQYAGGIWFINNLQGRCGTGSVAATGQLTTDTGNPVSIAKKTDGGRIDLQLMVTALPLDDELRYALGNYPQHELFEKLNPRGKVDANIRISNEPISKQFVLEFDAAPDPEVSSIRSPLFPYELKSLQGNITYRQGELVIKNLRGRNGQTTYHAGARCQFAPDGSWVLDVSPLNIDQLRLDHELQNAIPESMLPIFEQLQVNGYLNLAGSIRMSQTSAVTPMEALWDMGVVMQQNMTDWSMPAKNICGRTRIRGHYDEQGILKMHGELDIDSMTLNDLQVTRLTGPFFFNGTHLLLGRAVPHPSEMSFYLNDYLRGSLQNDPVYQAINKQLSTIYSGWGTNPSSLPGGLTPGFSSGSPQANNLDSKVGNQAMRRPLQAAVCDGSLLASGEMTLTSVPAWSADIILKDANLFDLTRDIGKNDKPIEGKVTVFTNIKGQGQTAATFEGTGGLLLKEAALYELPQIVKLFQILSIQKPSEVAFDTGYVDFKIYGKKLRLERLVMEGNALTMFGDGWLTIEEHDQLLDLTMNARLGNSKNRIPIVSNIIGGAGDQISQIHIDGPINDPIISADRFPGIKRAWWSIFPETAKRY